MKVKNEIFVVCKSASEWNKAIRIFIKNEKMFRGETALIEHGKYSHYKDMINKYGTYSMSWSKRLEWTHCDSSYYSRNGYTKVCIDELDSLLSKIPEKVSQEYSTSTKKNTTKKVRKINVINTIPHRIMYKKNIYILEDAKSQGGDQK